MDTNVGRRKTLQQGKGSSLYEEVHRGDIRLLVSKDLIRYARSIRLEVRKFLFFFPYLRADAHLQNGMIIGRGFPRMAEEEAEIAPRP